MLRVGAFGTEEILLRDRSDVAEPVTAPPEPSNPQLRIVEPDEKARDLPLEQRRGIGAWLHVLGVAVDAAIIGAISFAILNAHLQSHSKVTDAVSRSAFLKLGILYTLIATVLLFFTHRRGRRVRRPSESLAQVAGRLALAPLLSVLVPKWVTSIDKGMYVLLLATTIPAVLMGRVIMFRLIHSIRARGFDLEDTIVVGAGPVGREIVAALEHHPEIGLLPIGFVDRYDEPLTLPTIGRPEDLPEILEETGARHVVLAFGAAPEDELVTFVRNCAHLPVQFYTVPRFFDLGVSDRSGIEVDGIALIPLGRPGHLQMMWPLKRAFDIVVSAVLIVLTLPLFAGCALAVRLTSRGPIYFRQERVSVDNVPFDILKFRTMRHVADPELQAKLDQQAQAVNRDDDRITFVGGFLRQSHLDELPQLVNVLRGDMSIVGPRPERPYFVDKHSDEVDGYSYRHRVPAGITGWAQVNGFWGDSSIETRVRLDNRYIENWSPWRDLMIGLRTIPTLLGKRR